MPAPKLRADIHRTWHSWLPLHRGISSERNDRLASRQLVYLPFLEPFCTERRSRLDIHHLHLRPQSRRRASKQRATCLASQSTPHAPLRGEIANTVLFSFSRVIALQQENRRLIKRCDISALWRCTFYNVWAIPKDQSQSQDSRESRWQ